MERRRWLPLRRSSITRLPRRSVRGNSIAIPQRRSPGCRFTKSISFYLCWPLNKYLVTTHNKSNWGNYVESRKIRLECRKFPVFLKEGICDQQAFDRDAATDVPAKQEGQTFQETCLIGIISFIILLLHGRKYAHSVATALLGVVHRGICILE